MPPSNQPNPYFALYQLTFIRSVLQFAISHPFQLVKAVIQATSSNITARAAINKIVQQDSWPGLYRGGSFNIIRMLFKNVYRDPIRVITKKLCIDNGLDWNISNILTGFCLGVVDSILMNPIERLKILIMTKENKEVSAKFRMSEWWEKSRMVKELMAGVWPFMAKKVSTWMLYLVLQQKLDRYFRGKLGSKCEKETLAIRLLRYFLVGSVSGMVQMVLIHPIDTIKTLHQKDNPQNYMLLVKRHGLIRLYWGWRVMFAHYISINIMQSYFIQQSDELFGLKRVRR